MLNLKEIVSAIKGSIPFYTKALTEQSKANKLDYQFITQLEVISEAVLKQYEILKQHQHGIDSMLKRINSLEAKPAISSGYKGVFPSGKKWKAIIGKHKKQGYKQVYLGTFDTPEEAHKAYCKAGKKLHGEFANFGKK